MKQQIKVKYFSPDQAKYINPDLIDYVTLNNGSTIKVSGGHNLSQSFCQNPNFCNRCGKAKYMGQPNNYYSAGSSFVFRGGKKNANQTELSGAGIEIAPDGVKKENLKGAEGSLLTDILSGGGFMGGDQNGSQGQIPQEQGTDQGYYDGTQQGTVPQQYVPVPEQNQNPVGGYTNEYADPNQYYPGGQNPVTNINDAISYPSGNPQGQPQGVQEEYVNPGMPNENYPQPQPQPQQDYPQQPEEQIPVETPYIPVKPVSEQPVIPVQEPVIPTQPYPQPSQSYPYQQPSQQYPQPSQQYPQLSPQYQQPSQSYPYQQPSQQYQPMEQQPFIPPQVIPASNAAKTNAPVQQTNTNTNTSAPAQNKNNTSGPKSFKQLFKEARKEAEKKIKQIKNNVFRARKKEVQSNICPKCHLPKEILCPDCQREDDESRLNSQRNTYTDDQQKDIEIPQINYKDNNNQNNDDNLSPRKSNYQNEQPNSNRNPQRDDNNNNNNNNRRNNQGNDNNNNNRRNNQGNDNNNRRNPQGNDRGDNNRRNTQGNDKDNNRRNPLRNDNKNNRRNDYGNNKDNNRRNNQGNDNNRRNNYGNDNNRRNNQGNDKNNYRNNNKGNDGNDFGHYRRKSQGNDYKRFDVNRTFDGFGRRSANQSHLRGNSDYRYSSRTYERNEEYNMDLDNYRYYETNNTINQNRRTITIVKRGDFIIANHD